MSKIIYHDNFKFGTKLKSDAYVCECRFYNETNKRKIRKEFIEDVDESLFENINKSLKSNDFYQGTAMKGIDYFRQGKVIDIIYKNSNTPTFEARVFGTHPYTVKISKQSESSLKAKCSCPVGDKCKHIYATYLSLQNIYNNLNNNSFSGHILNDVIVKNVNNYLTKNQGNPLYLLNIINCLENEDPIQTIGCLKYLQNSFSYNRYVPDIIFSLLCNKKTRKIIEEFLINDSSLPYKDRIKKLLPNIYNIENNSYDSINNQALYFLLNHDFRNLFLLLVENRNLHFSSFIKLAIGEFEFDDECLRAYIKSILSDDTTYEFDNLIFKNLNINQKEELIKNDGVRLDYNYDYLKDLDTTLRRSYLLRMHINDYDNFSNIIKSEYSIDKDDEFTIKLILRLKDRYHYIKHSEIVNKILKKINNKYLTSYVNYNSGFFYRVFFTLHEENFKYVDVKELEKYFHYGFEVLQNEYDDSIETIYFLLDINDNPVLEIRDDGDGFTVEKRLIEDDRCHIANFVVHKAPEIFSEDINREIEIIKEKIRKKEEQKKLDAAALYMARVSSEANSIISLSDNRKASLQYHLNINQNDDYYYNKFNSISLKVGINKYYVVKSISDFFYRFENHERYSYGKDLVLTHDIDNFNDFDQKVLNMLMSSNLDHEYGKAQNGIINDTLLNNLLHTLKDHVVYIEKIPYHVSLEEKDLRLNLDKDYNFTIKDLDESTTVLDLFNNIYLINNNDKKIDILKCDKHDLPLYRFALKFNGICVKTINDDFKNNIYSNYFNNIDIDENIKSEYKVLNLLINSYFDYKDKTITLRNEYLLGENLIDKKKISSSFDLARLNNYEQLISSLGFKDNVLSDDENILSFFNMDFSNIKRYGDVYLSESIQNKQLTKFYPGKIVVKQNSTIMEAVLTNSEYSDQELYEIIKSIKHKKKFILLSNDRIVDLSGDDSTEFENTIKDLGLNEKTLSTPTPLPIINSLKALAHEKMCDVDDYLTNMISDISNFKNADYPIPFLNAELRSYQKEGFKWLKTLTNYNMGGILADDMGLGKTIQIIALIASDKTKKPSLIVCPKSLVFNWKNEFNRFDESTQVVEVYGLKESRDTIINKISNKEKVVYITSYESLLRDIDSYTSKFNYMIIDEAQSIKNVNAQKTKSIKKINAMHKFALTGTPIENNIIDLYSIFDFVLPGYFTDVNEFKNNNDNESFIKKLSKAIGPFVLRRTKENVLKELPEKYERLLTCEMGPNQRKVYDAHKLQAKEMIEKNGKAFDVLPYLMKLRQICVDPNILIENYEGDSAKIETLMELIKDYVNNGHKILLFSSFVKALDVVSLKLDKENMAYFTITGDTPAKRRLDIANEFNNDSKEKVALISLKAGGTGLNLIGADTVIHLDPWWNVAAENQASDRSHRIGQTKNVEVIKIICEDSIEQRVIELQNMKKDLVDKVISNTDKTVTSASLEDIKFILE